MSGQRHAPAALYPQERPGTHCTGGWVGPRAGLDGQKISTPPPPEIRSPDRPARSQSLYRLNYPTHNHLVGSHKYFKNYVMIHFALLTRTVYGKYRMVQWRPCAKFIGRYSIKFNILDLHPNCRLNLKMRSRSTRGTPWLSCLRHCATSRKVAGSIPDGVIGIFH